MHVILREDVEHLGDVGDIVTVKAGFARNFLLPRGVAVIANERQINRVEHERRVIESRLAKQRAGAEAEAAKIDGTIITIEKTASGSGKLFGSVTSMDVHAMLLEKGLEVDRRRIQLKDHIKALGLHDVVIKLHRDVLAVIQVEVVPQAGWEADPIEAPVVAEPEAEEEEYYEDDEY
jgi:large subunit ribosomal protein L9